MVCTTEEHDQTTSHAPRENTCQLLPALQPQAVVFQLVPVYGAFVFGHHRLNQTLNHITLFIEFHFGDHKVLFFVLWLE